MTAYARNSLHVDMEKEKRCSFGNPFQGGVSQLEKAIIKFYYQHQVEGKKLYHIPDEMMKKNDNENTLSRKHQQPSSRRHIRQRSVGFKLGKERTSSRLSESIGFLLFSLGLRVVFGLRLLFFR